MAAKPAVKHTGAIYRWFFNSSKFNQYGLRTHDMLRETPEVEEAIRRLPDYVYDERAYRIFRALHYCMLKRVLPKEEWVTHDDPNNWYLDKYLQEVEKENAERLEWAKK